MTDVQPPSATITERGSSRRERDGGERAMVPKARPTSYYGHPVIKSPVWEPDIAVYFFTGGLAGGSMLLAAASRRQGNNLVARRALLTAFAGVVVSPALLIRDLGMPQRFYNMLRVMKVTSPMSVGTWILSAAGGLTTVATGCEVLGVLPRVRSLAEAGAGVLGAPLATYTAALIADTSVPVWHNAAPDLPFIFAGTSLATAGAASVALNPPSMSGTARALAVGGAVASLTGVEVMERRLGELAEPYHTKPWGRLATLFTAAGAAAIALGGRRRLVATLGGAALLTGGFFERWSIFRAGSESASDPSYTVGPQRERLDKGRGLRQMEETASGEAGA